MSLDGVNETNTYNRNTVAASVVCPCLWAFCPEKEPATCRAGRKEEGQVSGFPAIFWHCDIKC